MADPLVVLIPYRLSALTMTNLVDQITRGVGGGELPAELIFDFQNLGFIEPAGIVFLSNLIFWLHERGRNVVFKNIDGGSPALRFLDDSQFFTIHLGRQLNPFSQARATTIPYTRVTQAESHGWLDTRFIPWLSGRLDQSPATLAPLRACTSELFNNIADHTQFDIGGIAAQHFPNLNRVGMAVADFGIGIPGSVRKVRPDLRADEAILLACTEGFTTQSSPRNRGAGLHYLLSVVGANRGTLSIYSGNATVSYASQDDGTMVPSPVVSNGYYPGTLIQIEFRTDLLIPVPDEEEHFEW